MAKFYGKIGFSIDELSADILAQFDFGVAQETAPGIWTDVIVEREYYGDVVRNTRQFQEGENLNNELTVGNSISIVADALAETHFFAMRYIQWAGTLWIISDVEVQRPRLLLRLGGVYDGPTPGAPDSP